MRKPSKPTSKQLSDAKLADLKENARGILAECRRALMARHPFVGSIAMNLDLIPVRDNRIATACTDGKSIYFDIGFLAELKPEERLFVFAHEVWHNVMMHMMRLSGRDHELFNIATDMEVNQLLIKDGFFCPQSAVLPKLYGFMPDLSTEEYYELLTKCQQRQRSSGSNGQPQNGSSKNSDKTSNGSGNEDGQMNGQFDKHVYEGESVADEAGKQDVDDKYGKVGRDPDFEPKTEQQSIEKIREAAVAAAQQLERQQGSLPAHIAGIVNKLLTPEIPWQEVLCQFVTRVSGEKRTWNPPNRRFVWNHQYLPSSYGEKMKIAVGIDTSDSTANDMSKFLGEVNSLVKTFGNYELHLIQCDTEVEQYDCYSEDNPLDLENNAFHTAGGGGTKLKPIFDYVQLNQLDVDAIVIFTDGYVETFTEADDPQIPTLWVLTADGRENTLGFGEITKFKSNS